MRLLVATIVSLALIATPAGAAGVGVKVPKPGEVSVGVVTAPKPPAGSKRASRVLRVTNAKRLPRGVAVYASAAPACSAATRNRFTALVVVTRAATRGGGAANAVLAGRRKGAGVKRCGSYPLLAKLGPQGIPKLRCDRLASRSTGALLLGSDATCIGAVQREIRMPSPYQLALNNQLGTTSATPAGAANVRGTATPAGEPSPGVFRYTIALENRTPARYAGVASDPKDQTPDSLNFAALGGEDSPNVVSGPPALGEFQCRVAISPGLPGGLACFGPQGRALPARLDFQLDFDNRLPAGPSMGVEITLPRYGDNSTTYAIDVTG